ncbi:MAG: DegQ family serine endoprotease [Pirellulaceae bacterium]
MTRFSRSLFVAFALLAVAGMGAGTIALLPNVIPSLSHAADSATAPSPEAHHAAELSQAFRAVAKSMRPSVVSIDSIQHAKPVDLRGGRPQMDLPPEFERFFGDDMFEKFKEFEVPDHQGREQRGLGTGVIVSTDGYIVTNNHVVRNADELTVNLADGRKLKAKVVGTDSHTDLAVLKVESSNLVAARLGDSDAMEVGDWVMALGTPFGLDQTVTAGIISAKGRSSVGITDYEDFLQTDAAINPGNSGGPLVNMNGEVVGINTAIASRTGAYNGIGFAIPSKMVQQVMHSIMEDGHVERGWLGAAIQNLDEDLAKSFGFDSTDGVLIGDVVGGSPAEQAGLQPGDIVLTFDGRAVSDANELRHAVAATKPETKASVVVFRDGERKTLTVTVGLLKDDAVASLRPSSRGGDSQAVTELGVSVQTLTGETAAQLGYDESQTGVVVTEVESGSLAARAGLRENDVIVAIGGAAVANTADFNKAVKESDTAQGLRLRVKRDGVSLFLFLREAR